MYLNLFSVNMCVYKCSFNVKVRNIVVIIVWVEIVKVERLNKWGKDCLGYRYGIKFYKLRRRDRFILGDIRWEGSVREW